MNSAAEAPLAGVGVLVTRPPAQAAALMQGLAALGARPIAFPCLAILPPADPAPLQAALEHLAAAHLAIFISPTAVAHGLAAARAHGPWPAQVAVAAVGQGTARALAEQGLTEVIQPVDGADGAHLLARLAQLPAWREPAGRRVVIFRGEHGREELADALRAQGAQVVYAPCYRRVRPPAADPTPVLAELAGGGIHALTAYSAETLDHLLDLLGPTPRLAALPLFVPHARIAAHAQRLGLPNAHICAGGEAQLLAAIVEYFAHD